MPEDPNEPVRVKDKDTGHEMTIRRISLPHGNYQELKQDAVDALGEFLPPKFAEAKTGHSVTPKENPHD